MRRTILVTGATRGLGRALALGFLDAGYRVIGTGRDREAPSDWPADEDLHYTSLDLEEASSLHGVVRQLEAQHEGIHGLINNAAIGVCRGCARYHASIRNRALGVGQSYGDDVIHEGGCARNVAEGRRSGPSNSPLYFRARPSL